MTGLILLYNMIGSTGHRHCIDDHLRNVSSTGGSSISTLGEEWREGQGSLKHGWSLKKNFVSHMLKYAVLDITQTYISLNFHPRGPVTLIKISFKGREQWGLSKD